MAETFTLRRATPPRMPQDVSGPHSSVHAPKPGCNALQCAAIGLPDPTRTALQPPISALNA